MRRPGFLLVVPIFNEKKKSSPTLVTQLIDLRFAGSQSETSSTLLPGGPAPEQLFDKYKWVSNVVNFAQRTTALP